MGVLLGWVGTGAASAVPPPRPDAAEIQLALKKLQVLASVLYVAAHPDDENTRLIATLANGRLADTAYLAMTRGDGGQNLIGPEIGDLLGLIRSQELLAARRIDGGHQFFTRAKDFGFSKSPEETLRIWNQEQVLSDTVRVFRQFEPDVVITRFPAGSRETHGHHTASARLAGEAMKAAADPARFPEQLAASGPAGALRPWRPRRIFWNTSPWFYDKKEDFKPGGMVKLDVGAYSPLLGESYTELAARARSMHRSQGFGSGGTRGETLEYLELTDGDPATADLFDGIDTTWGRVAGGKPVGAVLARAYHEFNPENPAGVVPLLLDARGKLAALPAGRWRNVKLADLDRTIVACLGLYLEAAAADHSAVPGDKVKINLEAANRSSFAVKLERVSFPAVAASATAWDQDLGSRESQKKTIEVTLPADLPDSQPYWLREKGTLGMFRVDDPALIGLPENPPALTVAFDLDLNGTPFVVERPVVYKWTDPARGEKYQPFEVIPAVAVDLAEKVVVFPDAVARQVPVNIRAGRADVEGTVHLEVPQGWTATPSSREFKIAEKDAVTTLTFEVRPPDAPSAATLRAVADMGGRSYQRGLLHLEYEHIPTQVDMPPAETRIVRLDLKRKGQAIGYIQGAGDQIPAGLRQIGYTVTELQQDDLVPERLARFDTIILGVRAYNTLQPIRFRQPALFDYVKAGGTLIVQYTTGQELLVDAVAPLKLTLSHDRVSEEDAEVRFLIPNHPVLNDPNKITGADFEGWVQERGLYFASDWDEAFQAVLSSNDTGEPPRNGGLLVAKYGKGWFVYTGYSWFREIPAGVPGAYRLFANLIALGH
jgi:LmbE family N-acetylglucosaminyl deacetylase